MPSGCLSPWVEIFILLFSSLSTVKHRLSDKQQSYSFHPGCRAGELGDVMAVGRCGEVKQGTSQEINNIKERIIKMMMVQTLEAQI
jgi:hypothetical protein